MPRRSALAGTIFCPASPGTVRSLANSGGLRVEATDNPHHYRLISSGRYSQPELLQDLLEIVEQQFDDAIATRKIEAWWPVAHGNAQFQRMEARNPTGKPFN